MIGARARTPRAPRALRPGRARALILAMAGLVTAIVLDPRTASATWQNFGLADGLASLSITSIAQDSTEALWFATPDHGVSRYDGASFRTFQTPDGLGSNIVNSIMTDREGRIWFATAGGASVDDHGTWSLFTSADGLASDNVNAILEDHAGNFWFATGNGVSRFDGTTWTTFDQSDGLVSNLVSCLYEDRSGNLWFGTEGGLSRFDGSTWTTYTQASTASGLGSDWIRCLLQTRDGALWVGTRYGGLSRFDGATWTNFTTAGPLTLLDVTSVAEDDRGIVWAGTSNGLARYDGRTWRTYNAADGLAGNSISALILDRAGNRWIGTTSAGVSRYDGESWTTYFDAGMDVYGVYSLLEDRTGSLWAGTGGAGVAHYDRAAWASFTVASTGGGLAGNNVDAVAQDSTGALWFGTTTGASRFDGSAWQAYTTANGLVGNNVAAIARDSSGAVWFGTTAGLSRFNGSTWTSYTGATGLPANRVRAVLVDRSGRVWCGTTGGVGLFAGGTWTRYTTADGLAGSNVYAILQDPTGAMWIGTSTGLSRFDGSTWRSYHQADGLAADGVLSIAETPDSVLWIGTSTNGVSRFDGTLWRTYGTGDGLPYATVLAAIVERSGNLWFGTGQGAALYEPAWVPPQTVITSAPPVLSANTLQTVLFAAAYREVVGIEFATQLDSGAWSGWGTEDTWVGRDLPDGVHTLRVAARDALHHVDPTPAACTFEIAATPPVPVITAPVFRQAVHDTLVVKGTAEALRFRSLRVDVRPAGATSWDPPVATMLAQSTTPVVNGPLASLATRPLPDGDYELRLAVQDTLGLTGFAQVTFIVDNVAPYVAQTTPALVSALDGGDVFTTNREAHVYIPPRGLVRDATVHLDPVDPAIVPASLPDGATRVAAGYSVGTEGVPLDKTATLDLEVGGVALAPGQRLAFYAMGSDSVWRRLGGTLDPSGARLATPISGAGGFAIYAAPAEPPEARVPLTLSLTPRVFSSRGAIATPSVQIGFVLARAATVRVTVHNRAGRLVRVVSSGLALGPGTNLVSWDGRDEDHHDVDSGLYLVTVEALGETKTQTLAVVR